MTERSAEIEALPRDQNGNANQKDAKRLITRAASDMDQFAARIHAEMPLFSDCMNTGMNSFIKAATLMVDLDVDDSDARTGLDAVVKLRSSLSESKGSTEMLRESIATLPRMTTALNKSKRNAVSAIDDLLAEFENSDKLLVESEKVIADLLDDSSDG